MMNSVNLPKDKELAKQVLDTQNEIEKQKLSQGLLGKLWGNSSNVPSNIAGLTVISLIIVGIIYTICASKIKNDDLSLPIKDFWAIISPLITLSIGYLFGDKKSKN